MRLHKARSTDDGALTAKGSGADSNKPTFPAIPDLGSLSVEQTPHSRRNRGWGSGFSEGLPDSVRGLLFGALCALLAAGLVASGALRSVEQGAFDLLFRLRGPRPAQTPIVIIVVDPDTVKRAKTWPMPRTVYTDVVRRLQNAGAKTIAFHALIDVPSRVPGDDDFAKACRDSNRVVHALSFESAAMSSADAAGELPERFTLQKRGARSRHAPSAAVPLPGLLEGAAGLGHLSVFPEPGGEWRRIPHLMRFKGQLYPSLALATAAHYLGVQPQDIAARRGEITFETGDGSVHRLPLNRSGDTRVNWNGDYLTFPIFSVNRLLDNQVKPEVLKDSIVLIGMLTPGSFTPVTTPFSGPMGVQTTTNLQANAIDDIVANRPLRETGTLWQLALLGALTLPAGALMAPRGALFSLLCMSALSVLLIAGAVLSLRGANLYLSLAAPLLGGWLTCIGCIGYRQWTESRELRRVRDLFGGYVGDEVLRQLSGRLPEMGGETREVTVLFCDIRGFTALSEQMRGEPARLLGLLNAHFEPLVQSLKDHGAYVDNYLGDLVIAVFGAPLPGESPAANTRQAVLAALDFVRIVRERNLRWQEAGLPTIEIGIGVHCGLVVVGNIGSRQKMHYTAIGDTVNIGSRVESLTRLYDTSLLVTQEVVQVCTADSTLGHLQWKFVDETPVKGRTEAVKLYRLAEE